MEFSHTSPTNSVAPVPVFPDHFAAGAKLLVTPIAILAVDAGCPGFVLVGYQDKWFCVLETGWTNSPISGLNV